MFQHNEQFQKEKKMIQIKKIASSENEFDDTLNIIPQIACKQWLFCKY